MKILRSFAVSPATVISFMILPLVLCSYYFVTLYTNRFVNQSGLTFFDVQSTLFTSFFLEQKWVGWFNHFMDFALWGIIATAILIAVWLFSVARVAIYNHYRAEKFINFSVPKGTWHSHFIVVAFLKILLVLGIIYVVVAFVGQALPLLGYHIGTIVQGFSWNSLLIIAYIFILMMLLQYMVVVCIKLFRTIQTDE